MVLVVDIEHDVGADKAADQRSEFARRRRGNPRNLDRRFDLRRNSDFKIGRGQREDIILRLHENVAENRKHRTGSDDAPYPLQRFLQFLAVDGKFHFSSLQDDFPYS